MRSPHPSSWPGLSRPSTSSMRVPYEDVDARDKPAHDELPTTDLPRRGRMDDSTKLDDSKYRFIGKPIPRNEDERLVTGHGRFSADFNFDGQTYAAMVRSPHAHARLRGIDTAAARKMPGVLGVFTGADCVADKLTPIPHDPLPRTKYDMKLSAAGGKPVFIGPHMLLPTDKARHAG